MLVWWLVSTISCRRGWKGNKSTYRQNEGYTLYNFSFSNCRIVLFIFFSLCRYFVLAPFNLDNTTRRKNESAYTFMIFSCDITTDKIPFCRPIFGVLAPQIWRFHVLSSLRPTDATTRENDKVKNSNATKKKRIIIFSIFRFVVISFCYYFNNDKTKKKKCEKTTDIRNFLFCRYFILSLFQQRQNEST